MAAHLQCMQPRPLGRPERHARCQPSQRPGRGCARGCRGPCCAQGHGEGGAAAHSRREALLGALATVGAASLSRAAQAVSGVAADTTPVKRLCDEACAAGADKLPRKSTPSGLEYVDIEGGAGPSPPVGFQPYPGPVLAAAESALPPEACLQPFLRAGLAKVVVDYVAMTPEGRIFDSSLDRGAPYDVRVGSGQIVAGLDEGIRTMKVGGLRRLYIPGKLSFPKGVPSAPGRPRVPPASPVVFDVKLVYIPGLSDED